MLAESNGRAGWRSCKCACAAAVLCQSTPPPTGRGSVDGTERSHQSNRLDFWGQTRKHPSVSAPTAVKGASGFFFSNLMFCITSLIRWLHDGGATSFSFNKTERLASKEEKVAAFFKQRGPFLNGHVKYRYMTHYIQQYESPRLCNSLQNILKAKVREVFVQVLAH